MTLFLSKAEQQASNFSKTSTTEALPKNLQFKTLVLTWQLLSFHNCMCMSIWPFLILLLNVSSNKMTIKAVLSKTPITRSLQHEAIP